MKDIEVTGSYVQILPKKISVASINDTESGRISFFSSDVKAVIYGVGGTNSNDFVLTFELYYDNYYIPNVSGLKLTGNKDIPRIMLDDENGNNVSKTIVNVGTFPIIGGDSNLPTDKIFTDNFMTIPCTYKNVNELPTGNIHILKDKKEINLLTFVAIPFYCGGTTYNGMVFLPSDNEYDLDRYKATLTISRNGKDITPQQKTNQWNLYFYKYSSSNVFTLIPYEEHVTQGFTWNFSGDTGEYGLTQDALDIITDILTETEPPKHQLKIYDTTGNKIVIDEEIPPTKEIRISGDGNGIEIESETGVVNTYDIESRFNYYGYGTFYGLSFNPLRTDAFVYKEDERTARYTFDTAVTTDETYYIVYRFKEVYQLGLAGNYQVLRDAPPMINVRFNYINSQGTFSMTGCNGLSYTLTARNNKPNTSVKSISKNGDLVLTNGESKQYPFNTGYFVSGTYDFDLELDIDGAFDINLYQNTGEDLRLDKTPYLTSVGTLKGVLRNEQNLLALVIAIEYNKIIDFNYVYIPLFKRYYYVNQFTSVRTNLWELSLEVDVLMSYKDAILECTGFIDRNSSGDPYITDDKIVTKLTNTIEYKNLENNLLYSSNTKTRNGCFAVSGRGVFSTTDPDLSGESVILAHDSQVYKSPSTSSMSTTVILDESDMDDFVYTISQYDWLNLKQLFDVNTGDNIISVMWFPFELASWNLENKGKYFFLWDKVLKNSILPKNHQHCNDYDASNTILVGTYQFEMRSFLDYEPYTKYDLFLPFYGYVRIDPINVQNRVLVIILTYDVVTGSAMYHLSALDSEPTPYPQNYFTIENGMNDWLSMYSSTLANGEIASYSFNLGCKIPIIYNNNNDFMRNFYGGIVSAIGGLALGYNLADFGGSSSTESTQNMTIASTQTNEAVAKEVGPKNAIISKFVDKLTNKENTTRTTTRSTSYDNANYLKYRAITNAFDRGMSALNMHIQARTNNQSSTLYRFTDPLNAMLKVTKAEINPVDYQDLYGQPLGRTMKLSAVHGYTEVSRIHFEGDGFKTATRKEMAILGEIFTDGVILP